MATNLSDHYPVTITCDSSFVQRNIPNKTNIVSKIKWDKVDKSMYNDLIKESLQKEANNLHKLENLQKGKLKIKENFKYGLTQFQMHTKK